MRRSPPRCSRWLAGARCRGAGGGGARSLRRSWGVGCLYSIGHGLGGDRVLVDEAAEPVVSADRGGVRRREGSYWLIGSGGREAERAVWPMSRPGKHGLRAAALGAIPDGEVRRARGEARRSRAPWNPTSGSTETRAPSHARTSHTRTTPAPGSSHRRRSQRHYGLAAIKTPAPKARSSLAPHRRAEPPIKGRLASFSARSRSRAPPGSGRPRPARGQAHRG